MSLLHSKIRDVENQDFQSLIEELYHCLGWRRDDSNFETLWYLLGGISVEDPKALTASHLPTDGILTTKIDKLPEGTIYDLCREMADLKRTHIESYDGKNILSLIKTILPKRARPRKPTRGQVRHDAMTQLIRQRRANGDR